MKIYRQSTRVLIAFRAGWLMLYAAGQHPRIRIHFKIGEIIMRTALLLAVLMALVVCGSAQTNHTIIAGWQHSGAPDVAAYGFLMVSNNDSTPFFKYGADPDTLQQYFFKQVPANLVDPTQTDTFVVQVPLGSYFHYAGYEVDSLGNRFPLSQFEPVLHFRDRTFRPLFIKAAFSQ